MIDYIDIMTDGMNKQRMEVVSIFKLEGYNFKYLIYRTIDKKHYYVARYTGNGIVDLDTNLSEAELKLCNKMLEGVM